MVHEIIFFYRSNLRIITQGMPGHFWRDLRILLELFESFCFSPPNRTALYQDTSGQEVL